MHPAHNNDSQEHAMKTVSDNGKDIVDFTWEDMDSFTHPRHSTNNRPKGATPPNQTWWNSGLVGVTHWARMAGYLLHHPKAHPRMRDHSLKMYLWSSLPDSWDLWSLFSKNPYYLYNLGERVLNFSIFRNFLGLGSCVDFLSLKCLPPRESHLIRRKWLHHRQHRLQSCAC